MLLFMEYQWNMVTIFLIAVEEDFDQVNHLDRRAMMLISMLLYALGSRAIIWVSTHFTHGWCSPGGGDRRRGSVWATGSFPGSRADLWTLLNQGRGRLSHWSGRNGPFKGAEIAEDVIWSPRASPYLCLGWAKDISADVRTHFGRHAMDTPSW